MMRGGRSAKGRSRGHKNRTLTLYRESPFPDTALCRVHRVPCSSSYALQTGHMRSSQRQVTLPRIGEHTMERYLLGLCNANTVRAGFQETFYISFAYFATPSAYRSPPWESLMTITGKSSTSSRRIASVPRSSYATTSQLLIRRARSAAAPPVAPK